MATRRRLDGSLTSLAPKGLFRAVGEAEVGEEVTIVDTLAEQEADGVVREIHGLVLCIEVTDWRP